MATIHGCCMFNDLITAIRVAVAVIFNNALPTERIPFKTHHPYKNHFNNKQHPCMKLSLLTISLYSEFLYTVSFINDKSDEMVLKNIHWEKLQGL